MNEWQTWLVELYGVLSFLIFGKSLYELKKGKSTFKETPHLFWMGIFVRADAVIFGFFWFLASLASYLLKDWLLFLLIVSVYWVVRSLGETHYWLNQQFSSHNHNPPENMRGYKIFKDKSIWFVYQITWQCITVVSAITTIYLVNAWLTK